MHDFSACVTTNANPVRFFMDANASVTTKSGHPKSSKAPTNMSPAIPAVYASTKSTRPRPALGGSSAFRRNRYGKGGVDSGPSRGGHEVVSAMTSSSRLALDEVSSRSKCETAFSPPCPCPCVSCPCESVSCPCE